MPRTPWRAGRLLAVTAALAAAATSCSTSKTPAATATSSSVTPSTATSSPTTTSTTPTTTSPPLTTTTAPPVPAAPQANASDAAAALVAAWASGNRARALTVATEQAVDTLFAAHYTSGLAISRGCSSAFPPLTCTYGPPGGGPTNAPIYQISVSQGGGGWYVSAVLIES